MISTMATPDPRTIALPYGDRWLEAATTARVTAVDGPADHGPPPRLDALLAGALDAPIGSPRLEQIARSGDRVTIIVSDATRDEPRQAFVDAVRARLPAVRLTIAIATGTHGRAGGLGALGLTAPPDCVVVDHDGHDDTDLVDVGVTARGTPVRLHRCVVETDLVVATGVIRAHYFAGFGAGAKAIFPGLAASHGARVNHRWKQDPRAIAGRVDDNPCRLDLEEAAARAGTRQFLLDAIADRDDQLRGAVAGDVVAGFRRGADLARPALEVTAAPSTCIVVADHAPVTDSLYQASKCVAAVAPWLAAGGRIIVVAPCRGGIGPVDVVNHGIYELGLRPRLPAAHEIVLVSDLPAAIVATSYARPASSLADAIAGAAELLVVPSASKVIARVLGR